MDGRFIDSGRRVKLLAGAELGFGRPRGFVLTDAGGPEAHALPLVATGPAIAARDGLLVLPSLEAPEVKVFYGRGHWMLESACELRTIEDGYIVETQAGAFRIHVPEMLPKTSHPQESQLPRLSLHFSVARNGEYIELIARCEGLTIDLKARAHHRTLLQLARQRIVDRELPPLQQGWIHQDELMQRLSIDLGALHLDIHRLRRQLVEAGIPGASEVIERRQGTRQLRIGVHELEIHTVASVGPEPEPDHPAGDGHRRRSVARIRATDPLDR